MKIICYKGMDNRVFMFGLNPVDFLAIIPLLLIVFVLSMAAFDMLGFFASAFIGIVGTFLLLAVGLSDKVKNRPRGIHLYLGTFMKIPNQLRVPQAAESNHQVRH